MKHAVGAMYKTEDVYSKIGKLLPSFRLAFLVRAKNNKKMLNKIIM